MSVSCKLVFFKSYVLSHMIITGRIEIPARFILKASVFTFHFFTNVAAKHFV